MFLPGPEPSIFTGLSFKRLFLAHFQGFSIDLDSFSTEYWLLCDEAKLLKACHGL